MLRIVISRLTENELIMVARRGKWMEEIGTLGWTYTLLYLKWITNKVLLYSTGSSFQYHVAAWMGGEFWGEWIHVYVWLPAPVILPRKSHGQRSLAGYSPWGHDWATNTICMDESLCCPPESITTLLIRYVSIQNKKNFKE